MKNIIILFGGKSVEHDISLITANLAVNAIDEEKYKVYPILVDHNNRWFYVKDFKDDINTQKKQEIFLKMGEKTLYTKKGIFLKKFIDVDCAILCHHGLNGEDGTIQGALKLCDIPFSSSSVLQSSVTMDKVIMKILFKEYGYNVVDYYNFTKNEYKSNGEYILDYLEMKLNFPLIVKPANLGSSIGIGVAKNRQELIEKIETAFCYDNKILVEKFLENFKEINCAVLGYGENIIVSSLEEPVSWKEFLTFDDKYLKGEKKNIKRIYPANLDNEIKEDIQTISKSIFEKFELCGVVRIDYILHNNTIYVNEINSIPGSLAYYLFEKENLSFSDVLDLLIQSAYNKNKEENALTYAFESNVLNTKNITK